MTSYQESEGIDRRPGPGMERYTSCLIPVIASILLLAGLIALINFLFVGSSSQTTETVVSSASDTEADTAASVGTPLAETIPDRFDNNTVFGVFRALGWSEYGTRDVVELGSRRHVTRKFRKEDGHVEVDLQTYESQRAAAQYIEDLGSPGHAVQLDHKVVVLRALDDKGGERIPHLIERLERFREIVKESKRD